MAKLIIMDSVDEYLKEEKNNNCDESIFEYRKATIEDIDELVRTRIIVLRAANKLSDDVDMSVVEKESKAYYKRTLETGEHIWYMITNSLLVLVVLAFIK